MDKQEQSSPNYTWTNRNDYQNNQIAEKGDALLLKNLPEEEATKVHSFFEAINSKSEAALVHFNDKANQMTVYDRPDNQFTLALTSETITYKKKISNIRNYFTYDFAIEHLFG